jgi:hypothetical protein
LALIKDGYWQDTYWASRYWQEDYWPEYIVAPTVTGGYRPRQRQVVVRRPKIRHSLLTLIKDYLETKQHA